MFVRRNAINSMPARIANFTAPALRQVLSRSSGNLPWVCTSCRARGNRNRYITTQTSSEKPYYITTPIFYVNAAPHVGHLYTMVLTDIMKRWQVLKGKPALLLTGTDEHGLKVNIADDITLQHANVHQVQRAAAKAGVDPKSFCDKGAEIFKVRAYCKHASPLPNTHAAKELARKAEIANDHFVRTTDREHKDAVEYAWV
jgi:methionyl-tRNA synthetase